MNHILVLTSLDNGARVVNKSFLSYNFLQFVRFLTLTRNGQIVSISYELEVIGRYKMLESFHSSYI